MKSQLKTLTWSDFDQHNPCYSPQEKYGDFSGTILDVLQDERIPAYDKIWAFTREGVMDDKALRLFAVRCTRQVQHLIKDPRSINALDVAEKYANGLSTKVELEMAWKAAREATVEAEGKSAWNAARAAKAAAWVGTGEAAWIASAAAAEAAGEAARAVQVQIAIDLINEFYEP